VILYGAMISRYSLELDLDISLHGSTNRVESFGTIGNDIDFILNVIGGLFSTNPCWSGSQLRVVIFNIILLALLDDVKVVRLGLRWLLSMHNFVKVIVNHFTKIDD